MCKYLLLFLLVLLFHRRLSILQIAHDALFPGLGEIGNCLHMARIADLDHLSCLVYPVWFHLPGKTRQVAGRRSQAGDSDGQRTYRLTAPLSCRRLVYRSLSFRKERGIKPCVVILLMSSFLKRWMDGLSATFLHPCLSPASE